MTPIGRSMTAWCLAGCFALLQVFVSLQAVGHAMEHLRHEATAHAPAACAWFHVAGESLEALEDSSPRRFVVVSAAELAPAHPLPIVLSSPRCSRSPPRPGIV
jgi:hypothetical protein